MLFRSLQRSTLLPGVVTVSESGLPGFEAEQIYALLAPAGTSRDIVRRLNEEAVRAMQTTETKSRLLADGSEVKTSTPQELEKTIVAEIAKWTKVIKAAGIKGE